MVTGVTVTARLQLLGAALAAAEIPTSAAAASATAIRATSGVAARSGKRLHPERRV